jgi:hypothetical protein
MKIESSTPLQGKSHRFVVSSASAEQVLQSADHILTELGYTPAAEKYNMGRVYTKGSRALRLVLGAFHKYNKIVLHTSPDGNATAITVNNESSGVSGGLIGMNQVNKEFKKVVDAFEEKLGSKLY